MVFLYADRRTGILFEDYSIDEGVVPTRVMLRANGAPNRFVKGNPRPVLRDGAMIYKNVAGEKINSRGLNGLRVWHGWERVGDFIV